MTRAQNDGVILTALIGNLPAKAPQRMRMATLHTPGPRRPIATRLCRWLTCAGAGVALAGCSNAPPNPEAIRLTPEPGVAVIVGWGNTAAENAREALTTQQGSRVSRLFVSFVNKKKTSFGENIVRLPPGDYDLTVSCGIYIYYRFFTDEKTVFATLSANRIYRLRPDSEGRRCEPFLEDVTDKGG
jgi:hypothetical protein